MKLVNVCVKIGMRSDSVGLFMDERKYGKVLRIVDASAIRVNIGHVQRVRPLNIHFLTCTLIINLLPFIDEELDNISLPF